jgi:hypothetical protein
LLKEVEPLAGSQTAVTVRGQLFKKSAGKKKADASAPLKLLIFEIPGKAVAVGILRQKIIGLNTHKLSRRTWGHGFEFTCKALSLLGAVRAEEYATRKQDGGTAVGITKDN